MSAAIFVQRREELIERLTALVGGDDRLVAL